MRLSRSVQLLHGSLLKTRQKQLIFNKRRMATSFQVVLDKHSTTKYFIEYDGFLSNHLSHGLIALHRLGSPLERLNHFIQWYETKLESPSISEECHDCDISSAKGKRSSYYTILKYYEDLYGKYGSLERLIAEEFPKLSSGLAGSALHGMIHLGYGFSVRNERVVLEGLAYLHHSNLPIRSTTDWTFGEGDVEILDILTDIAKDEELKQAMLNGMDKEQYMALKVGKFQRRVAYLLTEQGNRLTSSLLKVKLPEGIRHSDGKVDIKQLADKVLKWVITVYTISAKKNDFFLLHGVTAAWSMNQVIPVLEYSDALSAIRHYLTVLLAVYVAQGAPALTVPLISDRVVTPEDWDKLVQRAVEKDRDEHCYKLVQVCYELAKVDSRDTALYMKAAESVLENDFEF